MKHHRSQGKNFYYRKSQKMQMEKSPMNRMFSKYSLTQPPGRRMIPLYLLSPLKNQQPSLGLARRIRMFGNVLRNFG